MTDLPSTPREALEAAAKACDHVATELGYQIDEADPEADAWDDGFVEGCSRCVAAIRAIPVAEIAGLLTDDDIEKAIPEARSIIAAEAWNDGCRENTRDEILSGAHPGDTKIKASVAVRAVACVLAGRLVRSPAPDPLTARLVEGMRKLSEDAFVPLSQLPDVDQPNGWRDVAVARIDIARDYLAFAAAEGRG